MYFPILRLILAEEPNIIYIAHVHQVVQNSLARLIGIVKNTSFNPISLVSILKRILNEDEPYTIKNYLLVHVGKIILFKNCKKSNHNV